MRTRQGLMKFLMIAIIPLVLSACSSNKKDLGDSDGVIIGAPADLNQGTIIDDGAGDIDQYGTSSVGAVDSAHVPGSQADLAAQAGSDIIYFETNQHTLNSQSRSIVEGQARWLNNYPNLSVTVEGHADERGTREYNLALGDRRANAVKNYMIAVGVDPRRINTISYGKEQPLVVGADGTSWSQNRRARTRVE